MQRQLLHLVLALVVALGASSGVVQAAASLSFGQMYAGSTEPVVALPFDAPITVRGSLELGSAVDAETGFVSLVRINAYSVTAQ